MTVLGNCFIIVIALAAVKANFLASTNNGNVIFGIVADDSKVIFIKEVTAPKKLMEIAHFKFIFGPQKKIIYGIQVITNNGGTARLLKGGPLTGFAVLLIKSNQINHGVNMTIKIFEHPKLTKNCYSVAIR